MDQNAIPGVHVYVSYEQFFYSPSPSKEALLDLVRGLPLNKATALCASLNLVLAGQENPMSLTVQRALAIEFANHVDYGGALIAHLEKHRDSVITTEENVAVLFMLVLAHAKATSGDEKQVYDTFLRALLMINSVVSLETAAGSSREDFVKLELRTLTYDTEATRDVISRYGAFIDWSRSPDGQSSKNALPLEADLVRFLGLTYREYQAAAFTFVAYFCQTENTAALNQRPPAFAYEPFAANLANRKPLDHFSSRFSMTIDQLKYAGEKLDATLSGAALQPLLNKPLVAVGPSIVAPYPPYVRNLLGTGLFFALMDSYRDSVQTAKEKKEVVERYTRFFGEFFEQYIVGIFQSSYAYDGSRIEKEQEYIRGVKSTDLVIFEKDSAIFIEIVAKRFNYVRSIRDLDPTAIARDIGAMVVEKVGQIDRNVKDFKAGILQYEGINPSTVTKIFPVVATVQPVPQLFGINAVIERKVRELNYLLGMERLQILAAEEVEILQPAFRSQLSLSELLSTKISNQFWSDKSMKNYLSYERPGILNLPDVPSSTFNEVLNVVKSWGVKH